MLAERKGGGKRERVQGPGSEKSRQIRGGTGITRTAGRPVPHMAGADEVHQCRTIRYQGTERNRQWLVQVHQLSPISAAGAPYLGSWCTTSAQLQYQQPLPHSRATLTAVWCTDMTVTPGVSSSRGCDKRQ